MLCGILRSQLPSGIASACARPSRVGFIAMPAIVLASIIGVARRAVAAVQARAPRRCAPIKPIASSASAAEIG